MIAVTYLRTNHQLTSQLPSKESIAGKFNAGDNILTTRDPDLHFRMHAKAGGFYETAVFWQPPNQKTRSERIDFVTGSGEKGQTYLYCRGNQLFQLPVSYWTELHGWSGIYRWNRGLRAAHRSAMPGMPRDIFCSGAFSNGGECLPKKRVRTGDFVPEVPWGWARACGKEGACDNGEKSPQRLNAELRRER
jgi:hypothetical protein